MNTTIDEIIIRESGEIVLVEKTNVGNTVAYSRRSINVGDNYSTEVLRVIQICDLIHSESYLGVPINPENNSNWDNFNLQMMNNPRFNQVYNQCLSIAPIITSSLPTALDQVTTRGLSLFTLIWTQLCSIGSATTEDKQVWASLAEANNLPLEFINILTT